MISNLVDGAAAKLTLHKWAVLAFVAFTALAARIMAGQAESQAPQTAGEQRRSFDVVSIRPCVEKGPLDTTERFLQKNGASEYHGGRFDLPCADITALIQIGYNVEEFQIEGLPSWTEPQLFKLVATSEDQNVTNDQMRQMVKELLAERFHLLVHPGTKQLRVLELSRAKTPLKLKDPEHRSCVTADFNHPPPQREIKQPICGGSFIRRFVDKVEMSGTRVNMSELVKLLGLHTGMTVIDRTGIQNTFDFHLEFSPEAREVDITSDSEQEQAGSAPPLNVALREQLGLQMKAARGQVPTILIDHVEEPTAN